MTKFNVLNLNNSKVNFLIFKCVRTQYNYGYLFQLLALRQSFPFTHNIMECDNIYN